MTRRRLLLFAAAACLLFVVPAVAYWTLVPTPGVTLENFKRLHSGMSIEEVKTIMGRAPDRSFQWIGSGHLWHGEEGTVSISTDFDARMVGVFYPGRKGPTSQFLEGDEIFMASPPPESIFAKIRRSVADFFSSGSN